MNDPIEKLILIHYSEIGLKKGNRKYFEEKLAKNILAAVSDLKTGNLRIDYGRFLLYLRPDSPIDKVVERVQNVMGVAYYSIAQAGSNNVDELTEQIFDDVKEREFDTFCVRTRRADKQFPKTSIEINKIVGARIHMSLKKPVSMKHPDLVCNIEIYNGLVFYYFDRVEGRRGLPVGSSGRVVSLLSAGIDSPVSSYQIMKRGCRIIYVHFHSFPLTNKASYHNAIKLAKKLTVYQNSSKIYLVPLIKIQEAIILNAPLKLRLILYRRMMLRIAERICRRDRAKAIVTGESLGQVASQTLENIAAISEVVSVPVLRPLIGLDKDEIIEKARLLDTFNISTEPFDDCCSYLVPENPETRAKKHEVHEAENAIPDWEDLVYDAVRQAEVVKLKFPEEE